MMTAMRHMIMTANIKQLHLRNLKLKVAMTARVLAVMRRHLRKINKREMNHHHLEMKINVKTIMIVNLKVAVTARALARMTRYWRKIK